MLQQDSIPAASGLLKDLSSLRGMSLGDLLSLLAHDLVRLAISIFTAVVVFYVGKWIINKLYTFVSNLLLKRSIDPSLTTFLLSLVRIVLYFILLVTVIGILGLETSSFLALFASAGVAIGMALSGTLQNFAGGVLILLLKPFRVGDYIEAQGYAGTVKKIEIFNTIITTPDNKTIIIPNGGLSTGSINNSTTQTHRRIEWQIGISYGDDVQSARTAILNLLAADPRILREGNPDGYPAPVVYVTALADSSVNLSIRAWVGSSDYWDTYFHFNETFYTQLPALSGISFPFPQLDVHITPPSE